MGIFEAIKSFFLGGGKAATSIGTSQAGTSEAGHAMNAGRDATIIGEQHIHQAPTQASRPGDWWDWPGAPEFAIVAQSGERDRDAGTFTISPPSVRQLSGDQVGTVYFSASAPEVAVSREALTRLTDRLWRAPSMTVRWPRVEDREEPMMRCEVQFFWRSPTHW